MDHKRISGINGNEHDAFWIIMMLYKYLFCDSWRNTVYLSTKVLYFVNTSANVYNSETTDRTDVIYDYNAQQNTLLHLIHLLSKINSRGKTLTFKERGGGQTFSTSFWMRFNQAPLCRCRFKVIFDDIIFLLSGNIIEYICF